MEETPSRYKLRYLPLFWEDLEETVTYISQVLGNHAAAVRLVDEVEEGILSHQKAPTMAQIYKTTRERPQPYYWFAVGNYMVFYVVMGDIMEVRRMVYGARDLTRMLPS